jgi:L-rhamnose-H+ transport protein
LSSDLYAGMGFVLLAGIMSGTCVVPMKYATKWRWESVWMLFNGLALVLIPTIVVGLTTPQAWTAYKEAPKLAFIAAVLLGLGWGVGAALCGIGYTMLGVGLGMTIVLGVSASVGSALPLAILYPERLLKAESLALYLGLSIMFVGLALSAKAGGIRQAARPNQETTSGADLKAFGKGDIRVGLIVCVASGLLSSMFNLALIFGDGVRETALDLGVNSVSAVNVLWLPITVSGFVAIFAYCGYLLTKNQSWGLYFSAGTASHWFYILIMSGLYIGSIFVYGVGAVRLGQRGAIIGFPSYMATMILTGNLVGLLTGEWRLCPTKAYVFGFGGILSLIASVVVIALGKQN